MKKNDELGMGTNVEDRPTEYDSWQGFWDYAICISTCLLHTRISHTICSIHQLPFILNFPEFSNV